MKLNITLKDKITAKVHMEGYDKEEQQKMLDLLHQINEKHKKEDQDE